MKIAVINESFFEESHYEELRKLGELTIAIGSHDEDQAIELIKDANIVIGDMFETKFSHRVLEGAKQLKLLVLNTAGSELVDVAYARELGVEVADSRKFGTQSVVEHTVALLLALTRHIPEGIDAAREKPFQVDPGNQSHNVWRGIELRGKTIGIIGFGSIGAAMAEMMKAFGMKILVHSEREHKADGVTFVNLDTLLQQSDVVSLHVSRNSSTEGLIGSSELAKMKKTAYLISTVPGEIVDEVALIEALKNKQIAGLGLDMLGKWTWSVDNELLHLDNVVVTPHSAWFSDVSVRNIADICVEDVKAFVSGNPINITN